MDLAIQVQGLSKSFRPAASIKTLIVPGRRKQGEILAVDQACLKVRPGEVFGLVGPNGAGKTTLIKMLATLILPDAGQAQVNNFDLLDDHGVKASIGLMTCNERSFFPRLSCRENLRFYGGLHNLAPAESERRIEALAEALGLSTLLDKRYDTCSTGMKHRLALARSLLHDPAVLLLDEPTRSLDPLAAASFRETIYARSQQDGRTVLLVTHDLDEAIELGDRVGVMVNGRVRTIDRPEQLRSLIKAPERCSLTLHNNGANIERQLAALAGVEILAVTPGPAGRSRLTVQLEDRKQTLPAVIQSLEQHGAVVEELAFEATSWETVFASLPDGSDTRPEVPLQIAPATVRTTSAAKRGRDWHKAKLFFRRDLRTQASYQLSFVLQFLGILFSVASFYFVAQLFGAQTNPYLAGYGGDYFSFVLIGIAFVGYQGVALQAFSNVIQSAQRMGTLEAMLATPTRLATILFSSSLWDYGLTSLRIVVYLLAGVLIFGADLSRANIGAAIVILLLTILSLSGIGILSACFIMVFKRGNPVNFVVGSLSALLGGVYYPVEVLPAWLQPLARLFPLTYSLEAMRRALLAGESLLELALPVGVLILFALLLLPLGLIAFRYAVRQAKRDGSLTQF